MAAPVFLFIIFFASVCIQVVYGTLFHELGHFLTAWNIVPTKGIIRIKAKLPTPFIDGCIIKTGEYLPGDMKGVTELMNRYQPYKDQELIKIARSGVINEIKWYIASGIFMASTYLSISYIIPQTKTYAPALIILQVILSLSLSILKWVSYLRSNRFIWGDRAIVEDPSGYRRYAVSKRSLH